MPASKYIKIALIENNMQQKELAEKLGTSTANISQILKKDNIGYNKAEQIADILGYDIVWVKRKKAGQ